MDYDYPGRPLDLVDYERQQAALWGRMEREEREQREAEKAPDTNQEVEE